MNFPFSRVSAFIEELKADPAWTRGEIIDVQTAVIRELIEGSARRALQGEPPSSGKRCIYDTKHL